MFLPIRVKGQDGQLQCVAQVDKESVDKVMKSSGQHGVIIREY